jgi:hypothetical protein
MRELHAVTAAMSFFSKTKDHENAAANGRILVALKRMDYGGKMTGNSFHSLAMRASRAPGLPP